MKLFKTPTLETVKFEVNDVLTSSTTTAAPETSDYVPQPGGFFGDNCIS